MTVRYRVSMSKPHSHLFEVEAVFPPSAEPLVAELPVWTPGSYLVREYARHLQDLTAEDAAGKSLEVQRLDKRSFKIDAREKPITLRYRVYANELTVRTSHLDGTHGYFNGATLFLYSEKLRGNEHRVEVAAPPGWLTFCSLEKKDSSFVAKDYDELIDTPFEVGPHQAIEFSAAGVPHQFVAWGDPPLDGKRVAADLQKLCETEANLFGGLPLSRYVFLVYATDKGRGGLEHKSSTALLFPRQALGTPKGWEDFLTLVAHEYFHLWNVKRIKPKVLVPFDYSQESYTSLLWAFEGITSYYDSLLVRRAGLMTPARYFTRVGESISALHATPGRKVQTLAESSMSTWIKHYRPDENSPNSAISYYLKGEIVALLLDLEIRRATAGKKSLDDVMRELWKQYGNEQGVPEDGVETLATRVAGKSMAPFFDRAIRSTAELDYSVFNDVGLELRFREREGASDRGGSPPRVKGGDVRPKGWLGIVSKGSASVATVLEGSPAFEAGVYADDDIVALDGYRVDAAGLLSRCDERRPGETVKLTVFRRDKLLELSLILGQKPADAAFVQRLENPSPEQRAAYETWVGASWDEGKEAPA